MIAPYHLQVVGGVLLRYVSCYFVLLRGSGDYFALRISAHIIAVAMATFSDSELQLSAG